MLDKLKDLILSINAAIDSGKNSHITITDVTEAIMNENIFQFLKTKVQSPRKFNLNYFTKSEKTHLIAHWQFSINMGDFKEHYFVTNSGLCMLLALATLSIQPQLS